MRELRGTWSSAKASPSSSLAAPRFSDGGPLGRVEEEEGKAICRLCNGASDIMYPASLEAIAHDDDLSGLHLAGYCVASAEVGGCSYRKLEYSGVKRFDSRERLDSDLRIGGLVPDCKGPSDVLPILHAAATG